MKKGMSKAGQSLRPTKDWDHNLKPCHIVNHMINTLIINYGICPL